MKIQSKALKDYWFISVIAVLMYVLMSLTGCAAQRTTTSTTTFAQPAASGEQTAAAVDEDKPVTTVVTKTTTTEPRSDGGIFGGAFHLIGEVLAFPFRVIAGVFDAIF